MPAAAPQERARRENWRLTLLVNNAAQFSVRGEVTEEGLERTFAATHVVRPPQVGRGLSASRCLSGGIAHPPDSSSQAEEAGACRSRRF